MPFCPTCSSEFRPGFTRCEECDVDLVESLPDLPDHTAVPNPAFQIVYSTTNLGEAESIRILLEGLGIEADIQNRHSGFSVIEIGPTSAAPLLITVPAEDAAEASEILRETQKFRSTQPASNRTLWWVVVVLVGGPMIVGALIALMALLS